MAEYITKGQALYLVSYVAKTGNLEQARKVLDVYCEGNKSDRGSYIISACRDDCGVGDGVNQ